MRCVVDHRVLMFNERLVNSPIVGGGGDGPPDIPDAQVVAPLDVSLKVFRDAQFSAEVRPPVSDVPPRTPFFIELSADRPGVLGLQGGIISGEQLFGANPKLMLRSCVAMPQVNAEENLRHWIIRDLKAVSEGTDILKSNKALRTRFKMESFYFGTNFQEVHLTCEPYLCLESDKTQNCTSTWAQAQHN